MENAKKKFKNLVRICSQNEHSLCGIVDSRLREDDEVVRENVLNLLPSLIAYPLVVVVCSAFSPALLAPGE